MFIYTPPQTAPILALVQHSSRRPTNEGGAEKGATRRKRDHRTLLRMLNFRTINLCGIEFPPMPLEERPPSARRGAESFDATDHMFGSSGIRSCPNLPRTN